jgi:hypothetical protein
MAIELSKLYWFERTRTILDRIDRSAFCSYDPYDALSSRPISLLSKIHPFIGRAAIQLIKFSPVNFRALLGIEKIRFDPKVLADLVMSHINLHELGNDSREHLTEAVSIGDSLLNEAMRGQGELSWGLKFPYISRSVISDRTPNLFTTTNAALAILHLFKSTREGKYRVHLDQINQFITQNLGSVTNEKGNAYLRYYPNTNTAVYNVNALAVRYMEEYARVTGDDTNSTLCDQIVSFLIQGQNKDGSWFYSATANGNWIDGFHTGYILDGLMTYRQRSQDKVVVSAIESANRFYKSRLFRDNFPLYFPGRRYPIDSQNCAQAIQTRCMLVEAGLDELASVAEMVEKIDEELYLRTRGYYRYQRRSFFRNNILYLRWSQTPMLLALTFFLKALHD